MRLRSQESIEAYADYRFPWPNGACLFLRVSREEGSKEEG